MTNFCLPQPSFVPVKNNLKEDGTSYAVYRACQLKHALAKHGGLTSLT